MVRGITSATVVPTASDAYGEDFPSQHSHASVSDEEEGAEYSSEEEDTNVPPSTAAIIQSEKYLHAAFNGQTSKQHPNPDDANSNITRNSPVTSLTISNGVNGGSNSPQPSNTKVVQQNPVASLIGKSLRQRSKSEVIQKQNGAQLTKNYMELVRNFRQLRPFTRRPGGEYPADALCVYGVNARPTSVIFPCQHMCVCNNCIASNHISTDYTSLMDWW